MIRRRNPAEIRKTVQRRKKPLNKRCFKFIFNNNKHVSFCSADSVNDNLMMLFWWVSTDDPSLVNRCLVLYVKTTWMQRYTYYINVKDNVCYWRNENLDAMIKRRNEKSGFAKINKHVFISRRRRIKTAKQVRTSVVNETS